MVDGQLANLPTCTCGEAMLKSQLIQRIHSQNPHLYERDVEKTIDTILEEIIKALRGGGRVELRGFGSLSAKLREAHQGRNPRTGAVVSVAQKAMPSFKAGKEMHARLNPKTELNVVSADQVAKEPNLTSR
jgi:integration host factor subunit beta